MRGWKLDREIEALLRMKQETWDRVTSVTAGYDGEPVAGTRDPHKFDGYAEFEAAIDAKVAELVAVKREIVEAVSQVPDSRYRTLLTERYVSFKTWEQIAVDMGYSDSRWVRRLHRRALQALGKIVDPCKPPL